MNRCDQPFEISAKYKLSQSLPLSSNETELPRKVCPYPWSRCGDAEKEQLKSAERALNKNASISVTRSTRAALLVFVCDLSLLVMMGMDGHLKDAKFHPPAAYGHIPSYSPPDQTLRFHRSSLGVTQRGSNVLGVQLTPFPSDPETSGWSCGLTSHHLLAP